MSRIDTPGVYRATIAEHALGTTKVHNDEQGNYIRGGYPNFTCKLNITQKYVQAPEEIAHFKGAGVLTSDDPAWVDYSAYNYEITGFFCLFNSKDAFTADTKILGCDQVLAATGWTGADFNDLNGEKFVGTEVLIRVEEREFNGKTQLDIVWLDDKDASPVRELRKVDDDTLKGLNSKLNLGKAAPPKPAAVAAPAAAAPAPTAAATPSPVATPPTETAPAPAPAPVATPAPEAEAPSGGNPSGTFTKDEAWAFVHSNKGENDDSAVTDAWMASCAEVAEELGTTDEAQFTGEHWYKIAQNTKKDLGA